MIKEKLFKLQQSYGSAKSNYNKFGNYNFRNAEQMLKEIKPLLSELGLIIYFKEELLGDDYIKCTATLEEISTSETFSTESIVLVDRHAKGMMMPQCVGSSISFVRKYVLGGLLAITDSANDPDAINTHGRERQEEVRKLLNCAYDKGSLMEAYNTLSSEEKVAFKEDFSKRKKELKLK